MSDPTEPESKPMIKRRRRKISIAVLTAVVSGVVRAVVDWVVEHLPFQS